MKRGLITAVLAAGFSWAGMSVEALAQATPARAEAIRIRIDELGEDIRRADRRDTISEREASALRERLQNLREDFRSMNADGLNNREMRRLDDRIGNIRRDLRRERDDRDRRAG